MYRDSISEKFRGEGIDGLLGKMKSQLNKKYKNEYAIQERGNLLTELQHWSEEGKNP